MLAHPAVRDIIYMGPCVVHVIQGVLYARVPDGRIVLRVRRVILKDARRNPFTESKAVHSA